VSKQWSNQTLGKGHFHSLASDSVFQLEVVTFVLDDGEFPVDWGSGLSFKAKYRSLAMAASF